MKRFRIKHEQNSTISLIYQWKILSLLFANAISLKSENFRRDFSESLSAALLLAARDCCDLADSAANNENISSYL